MSSYTGEANSAPSRPQPSWGAYGAINSSTDSDEAAPLAGRDSVVHRHQPHQHVPATMAQHGEHAHVRFMTGKVVLIDDHVIDHYDPSGSEATTWDAPAEPVVRSKLRRRDTWVLEDWAADPHSYRRSSSLVATANLCKFFFDTGILGLPFAFYAGGYWLSLVGFIILGGLQWWAMASLVRCKLELIKRGHKCVTLSDLGHYLMGVPGRTLMQVMVAIGQCGVASSYVAYIAQTLQGFFPHIDHRYFMLMQAPVFCILCQIRNIEHIAPFSAVAMLLLVYAVGVSIFYAITGWSPPTTIPIANVPGIPIFFGLAQFALCSTPVSLVLEESMAKPWHFERVLSFGLALVTVLYASFSAIVYLGFGNATNAILMCNLPTNGVTYAMGVCLVLILLASFPMQLQPLQVLIEPALVRRWPRCGEVIRTLVRIVLVMVCIIVSISIPQYAAVSGITGAVAFTLVGFILPGLIHLKVFRGASWLQALLNVSVIVIGATGGLLALGANVYTIIVPASNSGC